MSALLAKLLQGGKILCLGDSTTMGYGRDSTDYKRTTWTATFASAFALKYNVAATTDSFFGCLFGYTYPALDSRVVVPTSWVAEGGGLFGYFSLGGAAFQATNTSDAIQFTPRNSVQNIDIYGAKRGGALAVTITAASGGAVLLTQTLTPTTQATAYAGVTDVTTKFPLRLSAPASVIINIKAVQAPAYLIGVSAYVDGAVQVLNAGVGGATAQVYNDDSALTRVKYTISALRPDLTLCCLGINDYQRPVTDIVPGMSAPFFALQYTRFVADVLRLWPHQLMLYTPNPTNSATTAVQRTYCNAIIGVAQSLQLKCFDLNTLMVDYPTASGAGYVSTDDQVHPTVSGYVYVGNQLFSYVVANLLT